MTIGIKDLPTDLQVFVESSLAKGDYPDLEHLMLGALYHLREQHMNDEQGALASWSLELDRRLEEITSGKLKAIPGEAVIASLRTKLAVSQNA